MINYLKPLISDKCLRENEVGFFKFFPYYEAQNYKLEIFLSVSNCTFLKLVASYC